MKEQLVELVKQKGFNIKLHPKSNPFDYYLWMCKLQRWLREVHKIIVEITWQMCSTGYEYAVIDMNNSPDYNDDVERKTGFKTYEGSLEIGLFVALKLIKS